MSLAGTPYAVDMSETTSEQHDAGMGEVLATSVENEVDSEPMSSTYGEERWKPHSDVSAAVLPPADISQSSTDTVS